VGTPAYMPSEHFGVRPARRLSDAMTVSLSSHSNSQPGLRDSIFLRWILPLAFAAYFVLSAVRIMQGPGLSPDEALFINAARGAADRTYYTTWFGVPVWMLDYVGMLKSWLYYPVFRVFPVSIASVRLPVIVSGALSLLLLSRVFLCLLPPALAALLTGVTASDPALLLPVTLDWGPVALMTLFKVLFWFLLFQLCTRPSLARLVALSAVLLLGIYDKLNFLWLALASVAASTLIYHEAFVRLWRHRRAATTAVALAFAVVLLAATGYAIKVNQDQPLSSPRAKVENVLDRLASRSAGFASAMSGAGAFRFVSGQVTPRRTWSPWFLAGAVLGLGALATSRRARHTPAARSFLFFTLVFVLTSAQIVLIWRPIGPHHFLLLWPLSWMLGVLGLRVASAPLPARAARFADLTAVLLLVATVAGNAASTEAQIKCLRNASASENGWSPESASLARYVNEQLEHFDAAVCVEWGVGPQLFAYTPLEKHTQLADIWFHFEGLEHRPRTFQDWLDRTYFTGKSVLAILSASGAWRPGCRESFLAFAKERGRQLQWLKTWPRSDGDGPLYAVVAIR
jgi:hypothetical protein